MTGGAKLSPIQIRQGRQAERYEHPIQVHT